MGSSAILARDAMDSPELTAWVTWLRTRVISGILLLLLVGRLFAHLPVALAPILAITLGAYLYNGGLALIIRRAKERPALEGDRIRTWALYAGGFLDTIALAMVILFTGGLISPWLYFFLATS